MGNTLEMNLYIQKSIPFKDILVKKPPDINPFSYWNLLYFVHLINFLPSINKKFRSNHGYVNLYSKLLQKVTPNYKSYINYLIENDIIEANNKYSNQKRFSKSYRISSTYKKSLITEVIVTNSKSSRTLKKYGEGVFDIDKRRVMKECRHLIRHFNYLDYDVPSALAYLSKIQAGVSYLNDLYDDVYFIQRRNEIAIAGYKIARKEFRFKLDNSSGRFHTLLTSLKSEFRHFLSYKGQHLISLDIKSSQPYLSQIFLKEQFWSLKPSTRSTKVVNSGLGSHTVGVSRELYSNNTLIPLIHLSIGDIIPRLPSRERKIINKIAQAVHMLFNTMDDTENESIKFFRNMLNNEDIYNYLAVVIANLLDSDMAIKALYDAEPFPIDRSNMKVLTLIAMYAPVESKRPLTVLSQQVFQLHFPGPTKIFNIIKSVSPKNYRILALILQAVEAELILNRVTKKIIRYGGPSVPFFTIHDSIMTLPKHAELVRTLMKTELESHIGYEPEIKLEDYSQKSLKSKPLPKLQPKSHNTYTLGTLLVDGDDIIGDTGYYDEL